MAVYQEDREWSDLFIPRIKELVGPHLLSISSFEEDTEQAADLVVLRGTGWQPERGPPGRKSRSPGSPVSCGSREAHG